MGSEQDSGAQSPQSELTPVSGPVATELTGRRIIFTSQIDPALPPPVRELADTLRMLAGRLNNTLVGYAASIHRDKATLSLWFSGWSIPDAGFLDRLIADGDHDTGLPLTPEALERIRQTHRAAQWEVSPSVAKVQSLRDEVISARQRQDSAEETVLALEEQLRRVSESAHQARLEARVAELTRKAQAAQHSVYQDAIEEENQQLRAELTELQRRVGMLKNALARAKRRVNEAKRHSVGAEKQLELAEDRDGGTDTPLFSEQAELKQQLKESDEARALAEQAARRSQEELSRLLAAQAERNSAEALVSKGRALLEDERYTEALDAFQRAAAGYVELADRYGEVTAVKGIADALARTGRFQEAIASYQAAAELYRELDDFYGEASALNAEGNALRSVNEFEEAVRAHKRAAMTYRRLDDRYGEALSMNDLGNALYRLARFEEAIAAHSQAAAGFHTLNDAVNEATALKDLGEALTQMGRHDEAHDARRKASKVYEGGQPAARREDPRIGGWPAG